MNKKSAGPVQAPAYLTKVKKEQTTVKTHFVNESGESQRHEKINFKQYLRNIKEQQNSDDDFQDIIRLTTQAILKHSIYNTLVRTINFGEGLITDLGEGTLNINESDWDDIASLEKDDSITIRDEYDSRWYVSRSLDNQIVFECQDEDFNGKLNFDDFVKHLN